VAEGVGDRSLLIFTDIRCLKTIESPYTEKFIMEIFKKPDLRGQLPLLRQLAAGPG
jgi:hypothetical protein